MARVQGNSSAAHQSDFARTSGLGEMLKQENFLWKLLLLFGLGYLVWTDRISIVLNIDPTSNTRTSQASLRQQGVTWLPNLKERTRTNSDFSVEHPKSSKPIKVQPLSPAEAKRVAQGRAYAERFAPVAQAEARKYGIPAIIILAQGVLESNAGNSKLAKSANNHFGIKCFSRRCVKGHCLNHSDDSHKDFFVRYQTAWGSYRAHSLFLKNTPRYRALFKISPSDYRSWARGLEQAGYATDPNYAEKLIRVIEQLDLNTIVAASAS